MNSRWRETDVDVQTGTDTHEHIHTKDFYYKSCLLFIEDFIHVCVNVVWSDPPSSFLSSLSPVSPPPLFTLFFILTESTWCCQCMRGGGPSVGTWLASGAHAWSKPTLLPAPISCPVAPQLGVGFFYLLPLPSWACVLSLCRSSAWSHSHCELMSPTVLWFLEIIVLLQSSTTFGFYSLCHLLHGGSWVFGGEGVILPLRAELCIISYSLHTDQLCISVDCHLLQKEASLRRVEKH